MALKLLFDVHCDTLSLVLISKLYSLEVSSFDAQEEHSVYKLPTQEIFFKQIS
jgi:hypothetical protein